MYGQSNLTRLQLLYWASQKLRPHAPVFNSTLVFTIDGPIDPAHFDSAWKTLLEETDALRTVIDEVDGLPRQRIDTELTFDLPYMDLSSEPDPQRMLRAWLLRAAVRTLPIASRMFDAALLRVSPKQTVWYLNQHHLVTDAASAFLLFERLAELYERSREGGNTFLPERASFEEYVAYERSYRESPQAEKAAAFWQRKLSPGPDRLRFFGRAPNKTTTRVSRVVHDLGTGRSRRLRELARDPTIFTVSEDVSLYNLLAALFFAQLHRMTGNRRLGFVTPVHNRFGERFARTIGLVMELCPFQVEIADDDTMLSLVRKVKRETRETLLHYQYGSGLSLRNETFDAMFNTYQTPHFNLDGAPVKVERMHSGHGSESLGLHIENRACSGTLVLNFDFHRDVFTEVQREQVVQSFVQQLDAFLESRLCRVTTHYAGRGLAAPRSQLKGRRRRGFGERSVEPAPGHVGGQAHPGLEGTPGHRVDRRARQLLRPGGKFLAGCASLRSDRGIIGTVLAVDHAVAGAHDLRPGHMYSRGNGDVALVDPDHDQARSQTGGRCSAYRAPVATVWRSQDSPATCPTTKPCTCSRSPSMLQIRMHRASG